MVPTRRKVYVLDGCVEVTAEYASAFVPFTGPAFAVFLIVFAIGALAQFQIRAVRGRYVNR
jgi:hypothetical protein